MKPVPCYKPLSLMRGDFIEPNQTIIKVETTKMSPNDLRWVVSAIGEVMMDWRVLKMSPKCACFSFSFFPPTYYQLQHYRKNYAYIKTILEWATMLPAGLGSPTATLQRSPAHPALGQHFETNLEPWQVFLFFLYVYLTSGALDIIC